MATAKKFIKTPLGGAVQVSAQLQLAVVGVLGISQLFTIGTMVVNSARFGDDLITSSTGRYMLFTMLYPLLLFAIWYVCSPDYGHRLHRAFIAALKTVALSVGVSTLLFFKYVLNLFTDNTSDPIWWQSMWPDLTVMATACVIALAYGIYSYKRK